MANLSTLAVYLAIVFFTAAVAPASSATHSVEWSLGNDYSSLATGKPYAVGDTIGMYIASLLCILFACTNICICMYILNFHTN